MTRPRCTFTYVGHPTTAPNTPADAKRIALSQWLTRLIGDEATYVVPGAAGYSEQELTLAPARYAHLAKESPAVPEAELQLQALALCRAGVGRQDIAQELDIPASRLNDWRKQPAFLAEWEEAKAEGLGRRPRSNAVRDSANAQRTALLPSPITPAPPLRMTTPAKKTGVYRGRAAAYTDEQLQELVLAEIKKGKGSIELIKGKQFIGYNSNRLAKWRANPAFAAKWDAALREGLPHRPASTRMDKVRIAGQAVAPAKVRVAIPAPVPVALAPEAVNSPAHYNGTEVYDNMLHLFGREAVANFCRLNAFKYRMRAGKKAGNSIEQDISKALCYEQRLQELA